ncbi:MAG: hypothetical protein HRU46_20585, partial [Verrucomicrobiales bacterium]|nr:hypothetical protein [Verrucomicrobiales bacterium]
MLVSHGPDFVFCYLTDDTVDISYTKYGWINFMIKRLLIFGCGGHGRELFWVAQRTLPRETRIEFVVDHERFLVPDVKGAPVHLFEDLEPDPGSRFIVALGNSRLRERAAAKMQTRFEPTSLVDPSVIMSEDV